MSVASADEAVVLPFLKWKVVDAAGLVQPGASLNIQGALVAGSAAENEELWLGAAVATVVDNIGQEGYVGSDLDPVPGEFLVPLDGDHIYDLIRDVAAERGDAIRTLRPRARTLEDVYLGNVEAAEAEREAASAASQ